MRPPYPAHMMATAQQMDAGGWTLRQITDYLIRHHGDQAPSYSTVKRWVRPDYYADQRKVHRERSARRRAAEGAFTLRGRDDEYRDAFIRRLYAEGVTDLNIRRVCSVVLPGCRITQDTLYKATGRPTTSQRDRRRQVTA